MKAVNNFHLGEIIEMRMRERKISVHDAAQKIGVTERSVYNMFHEPFIHPKWLRGWSELLEDNLFRYAYAENEEQDLKESLRQIEEENKLLKEQMEDYRKENEYLKEINGLLKEKK